MTSMKQITANRRNALKSTGPTTQEGKARSRRNAIRHGLTAETLVAAFDDPEDYKEFEAAVIADYDGETAVERELALRLASTLWRLRRASGIEASLFEFAYSDCQSHHADNTPASADRQSDANVLFLQAAQLNDSPANTSSRQETKTDAARSFLRLAELPTCPLDRLSRYEYVLWRQARQIVLSLESLKRGKRTSSRSGFLFPFRTQNRE